MNAADAALSRIRKLLALAADQHGTPEGEAAARLARRLIARYDLGGADLRARDQDPIVRRPMAVDGQVLWRRRLASAVARHCECALSWSPSKGRAFLYGRRSGIAIAEYLHAVLLREVQAARADHDEQFPPMIGEKVREQVLADFTGSAVLAVENRLAALRREESGAMPEQCALVSRRGEELRDWMNDNGLHFRKAAPSVFGYHPEGYAAGHAIALFDAFESEEQRSSG